MGRGERTRGRWLVGFTEGLGLPLALTSPVKDVFTSCSSKCEFNQVPCSHLVAQTRRSGDPRQERPGAPEAQGL